MRLLYASNPWWESEEWQNKDKHIREFESMKIRWIPKWIKEISFRPFSLNFIVGSRQVGKTTGIKLLIRELLKKENKFSVFYLDVETVKDLEELREIFFAYEKIKKENNVKTSYIFLDEVTNLKDWWKIVKGLIDIGFFKDDVIVATGSATLNILKEKESFPGRRGFGKDIEVLPLSFPEFLEVKGVDIKKRETFKERIEEEFQNYLKLGGYPKSVNEIDISKDLIGSIESEILKNGKSPLILKQIISALLEMVPSALSFNSIANKIGISNKTVESYIEDLENLYVLKVVYLKEKTINFRKEKKIFVRDPFLLNSLANWCNKEIRKDFLYEFVIQEHLLRKYKEIYYYKNTYEIDCIAGNLKVEVKAGKPHRKYPKDVIILEEKDVPEFLLNLRSS
jgi:predicted AAA+ superfamily ATPase